MKLNWKAAWPLLTAFAVVTAAEIQDIYDDSKTTVFQPELVITAGLAFLGVLLGTASSGQVQKKIEEATK